MIRVVVADDQPLVRTGLRGIIEAAPDLSVVGEASTGREAIEVVTRTRPDVVLMDVRMPVMDGLAATRALVRSSSARIVVLTTFDLDEYIWTAIDAGASGFLLKDTPAVELQEAVRVVAGGEALLSPSVTRRVLERLAVRGPGAGRQQSDGGEAELPGSITGREREVLDLVAEGLSNAEIAVRLHISTGTVKTHVSSLLGKLHARDRVHLVIMALRRPGRCRSPGDQRAR